MIIPSRTPLAPRAKSETSGTASQVLTYDTRRGVDQFAADLSSASAWQLAEVERQGVSALFLKDVSARMGLALSQTTEMLGIPRATASEKLKKGAPLTGAGGHAAIGVARLLARAQQIVAHSTHPDARGFDVARWLGEWIQVRQPALGGRKPADLLDTPAGQDAVMRVLGALESGTYQ